MNLTKPLLLTLSLSLSACLQMGGSPIKNLAPPTNHNQSSSFDYLNSESFDNQISGAMNRADADIQVTFLNPFFPDNPPERIDAWLTEIKGTGGQIKTVPAEGERDIISLVIALYSVYETIKPHLEDYFTYSPAKNYNATLLYRHNNDGETIIEKMVFTHR